MPKQTLPFASGPSWFRLPPSKFPTALRLLCGQMFYVTSSAWGFVLSCKTETVITLIWFRCSPVTTCTHNLCGSCRSNLLSNVFTSWFWGWGFFPHIHRISMFFLSPPMFCILKSFLKFHPLMREISHLKSLRLQCKGCILFNVTYSSGSALFTLFFFSRSLMST